MSRLEQQNDHVEKLTRGERVEEKQFLSTTRITLGYTSRSIATLSDGEDVVCRILEHHHDKSIR